jgi:hypothetical protein
MVGRDSSGGVVIGYGLDGPGIESRWGARFFAPVQTALEPTQPNIKLVTGVFPGGKAAVALTNHRILLRG